MIKPAGRPALAEACVRVTSRHARKQADMGNYCVRGLEPLGAGNFPESGKFPWDDHNAQWPQAPGISRSMSLSGRRRAEIREGNRGTTLQPARPDHTPQAGSSGKPLPGLGTKPTTPVLALPLDTKRHSLGASGVLQHVDRRDRSELVNLRQRRRCHRQTERSAETRPPSALRQHSLQQQRILPAVPDGLPPGARLPPRLRRDHLRRSVQRL